MDTANTEISKYTFSFNNKFNKYLPLKGGTVTGSVIFNNSGLQFYRNDVYVGSMETYQSENEDRNFLYIKTNNTETINNNKSLEIYSNAYGKHSGGYLLSIKNGNISNAIHL